MGGYIAIDPGGITGYAVFQSTGQFIDMDYVRENDVKEWFLDIIQDLICNPTGVICENWRLDPRKAKVFAWSEMPTAKLIGWLEGICQIREIPFVLQATQVKPNAYKLAGKKPLPKSNPMNHAMDAYVHGIYYLVNNNIIPRPR